MSESVSRWKPNQNQPKRLQPSWLNRQAVSAKHFAIIAAAICIPSQSHK